MGSASGAGPVVFDCAGVAPTTWTVLERNMGLITSDSGAMRIHEHQMALITSEHVPFRDARAG